MGEYHYHDIAAAVGLRINALEGTDPVELQITYSQRPLTDEVFDSSIFPFGAVRDSIIACESKIAQVASLSSNRTLRSVLRAISANLTSGSECPTTATSKPVIGNLGAVIDAEDGTLLTRQPVALVRNRLLASSIYLVPGYYYAIDGATLIHTRDEVNVECCVYSAEDQSAAFDRNDEILFPDGLLEAYINGSLALLMRDDEFTDQATRYAGYFAAFLGTLPPTQMEQTAA